MAASAWRGRITFGLVSIPVRLVKAARRERTRFRRVQRLQAPDSAIEDDWDVPEAPVQWRNEREQPVRERRRLPRRYVRHDPGYRLLALQRRLERQLFLRR